jgi:hypothetical protein
MEKDTIMELIKKEVHVAETLLNIINEISIEYRSTGEIIIRLYRPKEDNKTVDPFVRLAEEEEKYRKEKYNTITMKPKFEPEMVYEHEPHKVSER